mmetsp:Transcript_17586/g.16817  ORF Transcript_17586/g.16817 Transcript_17586/m.16817 type:complete len:126 (+) Transcript_17586:31-408(+)
MESSDKDLLVKLQGEKDWHQSVIFTDKCDIITTNNCTILPQEIEFYTLAYNDRDTTVGEGFFLNNEHYDVHRFHPPLIYGRRGGPDDGEGIALCRVVPKQAKGDEKYWFLLITYLLPILSAKAVP